MRRRAAPSLRSLSAACADPGGVVVAAAGPGATYQDTSGRTDLLGGGARMIPITTPKAATHGRDLYGANGRHLALHDNQVTDVRGVIAFLTDVDRGTFS